MVDRERISQPPLLPQVSPETIAEMRKGSLELSQRSFRKVGIFVFRNPLIRILFSFNKTSPYIATGGLTVYVLLAREAQKTKKKLPHLSTDDIEDYLENHPLPLLKNALINLIGGKEERLDMAITAKKMQALMQVVESEEYTLPSFAKFRPENPDLMNLLEQSHDTFMAHAEKKRDPISAFQYGVWAFGALSTYEILRFLAEKERMKGLGL